jgi:NTP pyrophosphatase (non-canonical NTP hydrolase)
MTTLNDLATTCAANSARWFPHLADPDITTPHEHLKHMGLGLGEEAGEVQGIIKKLTGYRGGQDAHSRYHAIGLELIDVLVYTLNIAALLDIDLDEALAAKTATCNERWGAQ